MKKSILKIAIFKEKPKDFISRNKIEQGKGHPDNLYNSCGDYGACGDSYSNRCYKIITYKSFYHDGCQLIHNHLTELNFERGDRSRAKNFFKNIIPGSRGV